MFVAGIHVRDEAILELARLVDEPDLASKLEANYSRGTKVLALTIPERTTILAALEDPPLRTGRAQRSAAARHGVAPPGRFGVGGDRPVGSRRPRLTGIKAFGRQPQREPPRPHCIVNHRHKRHKRFTLPPHPSGGAAHAARRLPWSAPPRAPLATGRRSVSATASGVKHATSEKFLARA